MRVEGDRRQPLQAIHGLAQPLHENGDERPRKQDLAKQRYRRRYRCLGNALVIAQVAWIGESREGPPDGIHGGLEAGRERERQAREPWSVRAGTGASFSVLRTWGCLRAACRAYVTSPGRA